jgi:hypothetical protein
MIGLEFLTPMFRSRCRQKILADYFVLISCLNYSLTLKWRQYVPLKHRLAFPGYTVLYPRRQCFSIAKDIFMFTMSVGQIIYRRNGKWMKTWKGHGRKRRYCFRLLSRGWSGGGIEEDARIGWALTVPANCDHSLTLTRSRSWALLEKL